MDEQYIHINIRLDKETMDTLHKMTKQELIERVCSLAVEVKTVNQKLTFTENTMKDMQTNLDKAESYVEQGRAMITAVMERWYEYDT